MYVCREYTTTENECHTPSKLPLWKCGHFERTKPSFEILLVSWASSMFLKSFRSFQRGTVELCRSKGCKVSSSQSWRFEKNSATWPITHCNPGLIPRQWDHPQSLIDPNFDDFWHTETDSASLESSKTPYKHTFNS